VLTVDASDEDEEMALEGANNTFSEHKLAFGVLERVSLLSVA
jgi:hypothetical protein